MFYCNQKLGFIIKGVFPVELSPSTAQETGRGYSALSFRINGNSVFSCKGKEYTVSSGSVAYIPKGVDYVRASKEKETLITVHFETFGCEESDIQILDIGDGIRPFFETLCDLWSTKEYNKCIYTLYKIFDEIRELTSGKRSSPPKAISKGVEYIERSFRSPDATIAGAARLCHVSEAYFRRIYTKHFGRSPISVLLDLRFSYAKSLLRSGYYETKQIAALSGFSDTKYFRTAFKKRFGVTPKEYAATHSEQ